MYIKPAARPVFVLQGWNLSRKNAMSNNNLKRFASLLIIFILISFTVAGCGNVKGYGNAMLQNLLESIDSGNYENFKKDLDNNLEEKLTEEEFIKLVKDVKEKYGDYKIYSTEFISSNEENRITTAYFFAVYSKNPKAKIMIKLRLLGEIYKISDFKFEN
jgi:predicted small secreted protein